MKRLLVLCSAVLTVAVLVCVPVLQAGDMVHAGKTYPLYPAILNERPDVPSPLTTPDGAEFVVGIINDSQYTIIPVTMENDTALDYRRRLWYGKGLQLTVPAPCRTRTMAAPMRRDPPVTSATRLSGPCV